jgi:hypothetical protein
MFALAYSNILLPFYFQGKIVNGWNSSRGFFCEWNGFLQDFSAAAAAVVAAGGGAGAGGTSSSSSSQPEEKKVVERIAAVTDPIIIPRDRHSSQLAME